MTDQRPFSWVAWIGGFVLAAGVGAIGNFFAGMMALSLHSHGFGLLLGAVPGALLLLLGLGIRSRAGALALGMCTGACMMLLIGGICGWNIVGTTFH